MSCYAPHAAKNFDERFEFFQALTTFWRSISAHGPKICMGDFNSRLYCRFAGEEEFIGDYAFFNNGYPKANSNRYLLAELCISNDLLIANTFFDRFPENLVTYRELATQPMETISPSKFAQLNFVLCEQQWKHKVIDIETWRTLSLASHHFPLLCRLDVDIPKHQQHRPIQR